MYFLKILSDFFSKETLTVLATCFSATSAFLSYRVSKSSKKNQDLLNHRLLKPQLFMKANTYQLIDYKAIGLPKESHYELFKDYNICVLEFMNINNSKILDLDISVEIQKNNVFNSLLDASLKENKHIIQEKDLFGKMVFSWEGVFPLTIKENKKVDILYGDDLIELKVPTIFTALLMGSMCLNRYRSYSFNSDVFVSINISYKHAFSDEYIKITKKFKININYKDAIQGPWVTFNSIIFEKKIEHTFTQRKLICR